MDAGLDFSFEPSSIVIDIMKRKREVRKQEGVFFLLMITKFGSERFGKKIN